MRHRVRFAGALAAVVCVLFLPASALALSGSPILLSTPIKIGNVAVAVDSSGTGYIAWSDTEEGPSNNNIDLLQYCVLPKGATACLHSGNIPLQAMAPNIGANQWGVQALVVGSTVAIFAWAENVPGNAGGHYEPIQEFQSIDGGNTWSPVNGGISVAFAATGGDWSPTGAILVPGTNELGYSFNTLGEPGFYAFPLTTPVECSFSDCNGNTTPEQPPYQFAPLQPDTTHGVAPGNFASELTPTPGVMGVFNTSYSDHSALSCPVGDGTAFAYGGGMQSSTNSYNIAPGTAGSAWQFGVTQLDCDVNNVVVAGGPSGFGVMERDEGNGTTVYHAFNQTTHSFAGNPLVEMDTAGTEAEGTMWQDAAGGIYAVWLGSQGSNPVRLAYSKDAGNSFTVNTIFANPNDNIGDLTSGVGSSGQGWAAWFSQGQVFAQQFDAADAISPQPVTVSTVQASGTTTGADLSIPAGTVGETDTASLSGVDAAGATGTMAYALYDNSSCSGSAVFNQTTMVAGGHAAPATVGAALAPGTYYWKDSYGGDAGNQPGTSTCGSEKLTVGPAATIGGTATATSTTITITITCGTTPCTVTITITVSGGTAADIARRHKSKTITLAKGTVTLKKRGKQTVKLKLTSAGKAYLKKHHSVKAKLALSAKTAHGTFKSTGTVKVKVKRK